MIFSKQNLKVVGVCKDDKDLPMLANVHFTKEGSTIGANGMTVMAVSPVVDEWRETCVIDESNMLTDETISIDTISDVIKNVPKDTKFKGILEHVDLSQGIFKVSDGKKGKSIEAKLYNKEFVRYKEIFERVFTQETTARTAVNLKRLITTLKTLDEICPDTTKNSIVYIDFTKDKKGNDLIIRAENGKTKQRAVAVLKAYSGDEGRYLQLNEWERGLTGKKKRTKKVKKVRKIKKIKKIRRK
jgi:hypothetical protein